MNEIRHLEPETRLATQDPLKELNKLFEEMDPVSHFELLLHLVDYRCELTNRAYQRRLNHYATQLTVEQSHVWRQSAAQRIASKPHLLEQWRELAAFYYGKLGDKPKDPKELMNMLSSALGHEDETKQLSWPWILLLAITVFVNMAMVYFGPNFFKAIGNLIP